MNSCREIDRGKWLRHGIQGDGIEHLTDESRGLPLSREFHFIGHFWNPKQSFAGFYIATPNFAVLVCWAVCRNHQSDPTVRAGHARPLRMHGPGVGLVGAFHARNLVGAPKLTALRPKGQMLTQEHTHVPQETGPMSQMALLHLVQDVGMSDTTGTSDVPHGHDRAARRLLGHPEVVADLLRGFAPQGPIREFDSESLSPRPDDRVDERLERRQSDLTWMFTLADGSRVVLIIESQSTVDRIMAVRMAVQTDLFFEGLLRSAPTEPIPGVLPVVFYTGRDPWRAARSLRDLCFTESADLLTYFAPACYLLIDVRRMPLESLPKRNRVSLMIRMTRVERHRELMEVLRSEQAWLAEEDAGLWRDYITWAVKVLAPLQFPDMNVAQLQSLQEGIDMINEGVVRELEESRQAGLAEGHTMGVAEGRTKGLAEGRTMGVAEGRTKGLVEGLAEGQRSLLRRQIVWKFGDATAERCADELSRLGDNGRMEELGRLVLDCRTGEEFLARL